MGKKRIGIIGVGGRTGTMFAFELKRITDILGIGRNIENIQRKKLFIEKRGKQPEPFEGKVITDFQFPSFEFLPEILFLTTKNPIGETVKYYYQKIKEYCLSAKRPEPYFPTLVLSQNGITAGEDALNALREVFGPDYKKIRVIRLILLNPVDRKKVDEKIYITYSLPIRICFGKISGPGNLQDIALIFKEAEFEVKQFPPEEIKNLEFSKLFLNLIGMASASQGFSIKQGFQNSEIFREELRALKEYIKIVRASGGEFLNLLNYPVRLLTFLFDILPTDFFLPFKNYFAGLMSRGRKGKVKDLTEIKYYNGAVVNLGRKIGTPTYINQKILDRGS